MNERELRVLRAMVNRLRAIHQEIHTIGEDQCAGHSKTEDKPIQPLQIKITETPQLDPARQEYYQAENRDRHSLWNFVRPWVEGLGVLIGLALLGLNIATLNQVQRQADIAEAENRPWIKIVDITTDPVAAGLPQPVVFDFVTLPTVRGPKIGANIHLEITVKNIGKGIARGVFVSPVLMFYRWNSTENTATEQARICSQMSNYNPGTPPFVWATIFPDETRKSRIGTVGLYDNDMFFHPSDRPGNWIAGTVFGCIFYQSPREYETSAVFVVMGEHDRFIEVGKPISKAAQIRLLRDEHYEDAR